jgi:hypothetical protein
MRPDTFHGFVLDRVGLNDRGQLVGAYENTAAAAGPAPPMDGLAQRSGWEPTGNGSARSRSTML